MGLHHDGRGRASSALGNVSLRWPSHRAGFSPSRYPRTRAQSKTRSIRPRMRAADSGVFVQIGSNTFRTRPVSIAETGRPLIACVAAGKDRAAAFRLVESREPLIAVLRVSPARTIGLDVCVGAFLERHRARRLEPFAGPLAAFRSAIGSIPSKIFDRTPSARFWPPRG